MDQPHSPQACSDQHQIGPDLEPSRQMEEWMAVKHLVLEP